MAQAIPQTDTEIVNAALAHLGQTRFLRDLDSDRGVAATLGRQFFAMMREQVFSEYPWSRATVIAQLTLVSEEPNDEWDFAHRYPTNCLFPRRILSGWRTDTADSLVPYRVIKDASGLLILSDIEDPQLEYTSRENNISRDPASLAMAQSFLLAYLMAPGLTAGDPFKLGGRAANSYASIIANAKAQDANSEQPDQPADASWIRARR